jgi:hypothetical protein
MKIVITSNEGPGKTHYQLALDQQDTGRIIEYRGLTWGESKDNLRFTLFEHPTQFSEQFKAHQSGSFFANIGGDFSSKEELETMIKQKGKKMPIVSEGVTLGYATLVVAKA